MKDIVLNSDYSKLLAKLDAERRNLMSKVLSKEELESSVARLRKLRTAKYWGE